MAIALESIDLIVPISKIRDKYPEGRQACLNDHAHLIGGRAWYDEHLFKDGAMNPNDIRLMIQRWTSLWFETIEIKDGQQVWKDSAYCRRSVWRADSSLRVVGVRSKSTNRLS